MKQRWKAILAGSLVGVTTLLAACGSQSSGNLTHIDTPWWTTEGTLNKNDDGSVKFENVSLNLVTVVAGADLTPFKGIVEKFNKAHEGQINVKVESVNEESYASQIANRIQVGMNTPDLLMTHAKLQKGLVSKEHLQPLDEIIAETGYEMDWTNYSEVLAKDSNLGFDNGTFTVPVDMQSEVVLYNKQILDDLGMSVPQTRDEFLAVCEAFNEAYAGRTGYNAVLMPTEGGHFHQYVYPTAYLQNGGELYDEKTNKVNWTAAKNTQAFKDANESILSLKEAGYMKLGEEENDAMLRFYENKGLFLFIPPWRIATGGGVFESYATANGINVNAVDYMSRVCERIGGMSLARLFALDSTKECAEYVYIDSHSFSVSVSVKDINKKAACLYFMKWFTENGETAAEWAKYGHNSCNAQVINSEAYTGSVFVQEISQHFYDANMVKTIGCNPFAGDLIKHLNGLSPKLLASPTTLESAIADTQKKYNGQIEFDEEY